MFRNAKIIIIFINVLKRVNQLKITRNYKLNEENFYKLSLFYLLKLEGNNLKVNLLHISFLFNLKRNKNRNLLHNL